MKPCLMCMAMDYALNSSMRMTTRNEVTLLPTVHLGTKREIAEDNSGWEGCEGNG